MNYTKEEFETLIKDAIKEDIHWAYGHWIEGNQLNESQYATSQEELAQGIIDDINVVEMYEELKAIKNLCDGYAELDKETCSLYIAKILAKAEGKEE